jgi:DNA-binding beta-propeller fold protein YncE
VSKASIRRGWLAALSCILAGLFVSVPAQAAGSEPLFVFTPTPPKNPPFLPPPLGFLEGPCGMGVDPAGRFYVSDYYHDTVDAYDQNADYNSKVPPVTGATGYLGQLGAVDAIDGPCALAFDASAHLYVNDYHRAVKRYGALGSFGAAQTITGATTPEGTHPTGVAVDPATGNVYVDQRTHVSVFDASGAPVVDETEPLNPKPLQIGNGPLKDGYGIAFSQYPGTSGYLYVPDAATNTIEVYDSATPDAAPVETIDGTETPEGKFVSLRDASIAVDRVTGEIYVVDDLQPQYTERPQAIVYVFNPDGSYEGHLKLLITWGMPSGLAVDNSETATQGRVYVTSGNTALGGIYAYGPGAATTAPIALPSAAPAPSDGGSGSAQGEEPPTPGTAATAVPQPAQSFGVAATGEAVTSPATPRLRAAKAHRKARKKHRRAHPRRSKRVR